MYKRNDSLHEIAALASSATSQPTATSIPGVVLIKGEVPKDQLAALYEPMIGFTVQGSKTISIGNQVLTAKAPSYFVIPTELPATASVQQGPNGLPYISVGLRLNEEAVVSLLNVLPPVASEERDTDEFTICAATDEFVDAWLRLLRLMNHPEDIDALAPIYEREIHYRVLSGPEGWRIRQLCSDKNRSSNIRRAVHWIRQNFSKSIDVERVAKKHAMSERNFHRQFKNLTGLSPIQYQKNIRLLEARKLMTHSSFTVAEAAYEVGYESASQFNREYTRLFGSSPARDSTRIRNVIE